ncbi:hypothetical protein TNCV_3735181 [Trichonephila clavipes]|nr:hypothetical protein TNCV_3735181 [Trichonephila clavipes]
MLAWGESLVRGYRVQVSSSLLYSGAKLRDAPNGVSECLLTSHIKKTRGLRLTNLVILSHAQVRRTTPILGLPSDFSIPRQRKEFEHRQIKVHDTFYTTSSVVPISNS